MIQPPDDVAALRCAVAARPHGVMLESVAWDESWGRYSIFAADPVRVVTISGVAAGDPFAQLSAVCRPWLRLEPDSDLPFVGGWIGYIAYEAGRIIEPSVGAPACSQVGQCPSTSCSDDLPLSHWVLYDTVLVHDGLTDEWAVAGVTLPTRLAGPERPPLSIRLNALERCVADEVSVISDQRSAISIQQSAVSPQSKSPRPSEPACLAEPACDKPALWPVFSPGGSRATSGPLTDAGRWNVSHEAYLAKVGRALDYIRAGDIFQVNLARRCRVDVTAEPIELYQRLCEANPATYAAYIRIAVSDQHSAFSTQHSAFVAPASPWHRRLAGVTSRASRSSSHRRDGGATARIGATDVLARTLGTRHCPTAQRAGSSRAGLPAGGSWAVLSSSPELFLGVRGRDVTTRPIKGTRPRGETPTLDAAARHALADSAKDRAELNMIIDLERNDLGRVCEYGTIHVASDGDIETCPTVFHRTATVTGRLRDDADAIDLLRATFPGGSVTGAPKVRAMQIIHELEPAPRGPYCGAIGCIGLDGDMQLNLPIRTMTVAANPLVGRSSVTLHVGSGIVADSTPEDEYMELQAKAAGMMAALSDEFLSKEPPTLVGG